MSFHELWLRQERQATIPSKRRERYVAFKRISPCTTREPSANTHDNEKGAPPHRNSASSVHNAPLRDARFHGNFLNFQTGKPGSTRKLKKAKTCDLYQITAARRTANEEDYTLPMRAMQPRCAGVPATIRSLHFIATMLSYWGFHFALLTLLALIAFFRKPCTIPGVGIFTTRNPRCL